jgi:hypothetical protein
MRLEVLEAERAMVLRSEDGSWVWSFGLYPQSESLTRLVSRNRIQDPRTGLATRVVSMFLMEPGSLVMERKMLLGIKERAERLHARGLMPTEPLASGSGRAAASPSPAPATTAEAGEGTRLLRQREDRRR